jgi:hypothetical protein
MRGGFYPTAMGAILRNGPIFISSAVVTALKLIRGDKDRMKSRKIGKGRTPLGARGTLGRGHTTRKVKRTKK